VSKDDRVPEKLIKLETRKQTPVHINIQDVQVNASTIGIRINWK
jgi:hypothetical protein